MFTLFLSLMLVGSVLTGDCDLANSNSGKIGHILSALELNQETLQILVDKLDEDKQLLIMAGKVFHAIEYDMNIIVDRCNALERRIEILENPPMPAIITDSYSPLVTNVHPLSWVVKHIPTIGDIETHINFFDRKIGYVYDLGDFGEVEMRYDPLNDEFEMWLRQSWAEEIIRDHLRSMGW